MGRRKIVIEPPEPMTGAEIRDWRDRHNVGLRELARILHVPHTTLIRWEKDRPTAPLYLRWALAGIAWTWFMDEQERLAMEAALDEEDEELTYTTASTPGARMVAER